MTTKTAINPWSWQDARGFSQAWRIEQPTTIVQQSGQVSVPTAVEVASFAMPGLMIELDATAVL